MIIKMYAAHKSIKIIENVRNVSIPMFGSKYENRVEMGDDALNDFGRLIESNRIIYFLPKNRRTHRR